MGCCEGGDRNKQAQTKDPNEGNNPGGKTERPSQTAKPQPEVRPQPQPKSEVSTKPQTKPEVSPKPAEVPPQPASFILHTSSQSALRFERVFRVLAGNTRIERRVTQNLSTIGALITRDPVAETNGKFLSGERVIARYLAQQHALYPVGPVQIYECESLVEQLEDMWKSLEKGDDEAVYTAAELLQAVERRLKPEQKYYGGDKPNYADVVVFCFLSACFLSEAVREVREGAVPQRLIRLMEQLKTQPLFKQA